MGYTMVTRLAGIEYRYTGPYSNWSRPLIGTLCCLLTYHKLLIRTSVAHTEWPKYLALGKADWSELAGRELYNHSSDPEENRNVVAEPASATVVVELSRQLRVGWRGALIPPQ